MHPFILLSLLLPLPHLILAQQTPTIPLGGNCTSSSQCLSNATCYAVNSMLIPRCGNFQASCTNTSQCVNGATCYNSNPSISNLSYCGAWNATCTADNQCAWNTCSNGTCSGSIPLGQGCSLDGSQCENGAECYSPSKYTDGICGAFGAQCTTDTQCFDYACFKTSGSSEYGTCTGRLGNGNTTSMSLEGSTTEYSSTTTSTGAATFTTSRFYGNSTITTPSPTQTQTPTLTSTQGLTSCPEHASCVIVYPSQSESVVTISQITVITGTATHSSGGSASPTATTQNGAVREEGMRGWVMFAVILWMGMEIL